MKKTKLILIIDDSADNRVLLETILRSNGWNVLSASDGAEALQLLESELHLPDLILLDLQMPGMNGREFRQKQRQIARIRSIPVIVMSGSSNTQEIDEICPDGLLSKPLNLSTVVHNVGSFLYSH